MTLQAELTQPVAAIRPAEPSPGGPSRERLATACPCCGSASLAASPAILMPFVAHRAFGWAPVEIDASWGLNTIRNGMAYTVCKSLRCRKCEHLFCDIRFSDAEMGAIYAGYREEAYVALRDQYEPGYRQRNEGLVETVSYKGEIERFLEPWIADPLTILDWGGDTGSNTPFEARRAALDIFEISGKGVIPGARLVDEAEATAGTYRLVICGQLLEHTPHPADILAKVRRAMDAQSVLYIEVPFETIMQHDMADRETKKRHWHEHINFYSPQSLAALLQACCFEVLDQAVLPIAIGGAEARILQAACRIATPA